VSEEVRLLLPRLGFRSAMTTIGVSTATAPAIAWNLQRIEAENDVDTIGYWTSGAHPHLSRRLFFGRE
jgi:hypothetical protein